MIQKEVGDRLTASPGGKDYGRLTVMTAFYADVEQIVNVSRNCFYPRPEVDSAVVQITPRADRQTRLSETVFQDLLRVAFQKRRKTILNILSSHYNMDKAEIQTRLGTLGLNPESRPENLTIKDYINLSQEFAQ
jgi:16S rRNA (adenine1518-N6/adenine1519-N6)-dimethyltransferase